MNEEDQVVAWNISSSTGAYLLFPLNIVTEMEYCSLQQSSDVDAEIHSRCARTPCTLQDARDREIVRLRKADLVNSPANNLPLVLIDSVNPRHKHRNLEFSKK